MSELARKGERREGGWKEDRERGNKGRSVARKEEREQEREEDNCSSYHHKHVHHYSEYNLVHSYTDSYQQCCYRSVHIHHY